MAGARAPISRVIVLITLLGLAAFALRGTIPGVSEDSGVAEGARRSAQSAISVALMPVLLTVSG